ncbi:alpha/beta hydrolase [Streptomyces sp. NBC_00390]|uniref:alpha/beta hydrolase n=1 Tax=Streptomyces sp. NBC_00390 TaxID=2975736 RepID=UPI003FCE92AA
MASRQRTSRLRTSSLRTSRPRTRSVRASPLRRTLLAAFVAASVALPVSGAVRPSAVPAPAPAALAPLEDATPLALAERYAAQRDEIRAAERSAAGHGDRRRAKALRAMAAPARSFLFFDGRDGGRSAEVFGDLSRTGRIAVLVPGSDTNLDSYGRFRAGAEALARELGSRSAVVAWLGYGTPGTVSPAVVTPSRGQEAAPELRSFVRELSQARPTARVSLVCHSYGSVVCARAARTLEVTDVVLYGSPGVGYDHTADLRTPATVWAGRSTGDWVAHLPHTQLELPFTAIGLGADPISPEFGARRFEAGGGGHSDYLKPGSVPLRNIARIVSGQAPSEGGRHA